MRKILVVGIDSMDSYILNSYCNILPNLARLFEINKNIRILSVFPPDSDTAWASIFTGLNPAKHGIVNFVDPLMKASIYQTDYLNSRNIQGKTFWDIASKYGKKVCLLYPHIGYPVWGVNGFMISRSPKSSDLQIYPPESKIQFDLTKFSPPTRIPNSSSEYQEYIENCKNVIINDFKFAEYMYQHQEWDIFFFYSSILDFIQHIFWSYWDPNDPMFPGENNPFRNVIKDFYILYDTLIGELIDSVDSDTAILVLSDHGHSMRPVNLININEILRNEGYLFPKTGSTAYYSNVKEKMKRFVVNIAQKTHFRSTALKILRKYPKIKEAYTIPSSIDFSRTIAHCSDLSGMKSYNYGGIFISKQILKNKDEFFSVREDIIKKLREYRVPNSNNPVFEWICRREDLYNGEFIQKYPDILFKLEEGYGAGWAINIPVYSKATTHSFFPGSHRGDTPIFLSNIDLKKEENTIIQLMDIAPTVIDLIGITNKDLQFDGKSILKGLKTE